MLGLTVFAGLCAAWWLFPVGLVIWGVMVWLIVRDPSLRLSHSMQKRGVLAPRFKKYFNRIERSQVGIFNTIASSKPHIRRELEPIQVAVDELTDHVYNLCRRMTLFESYRAISQSEVELETALARLNKQIAEAGDSLTRQKYEEAREALEDRLGSVRAVSTQIKRVEAQLSSLTHELDGVFDQVIRIHTLDTRTVSGQSSALVNELNRHTEELKLFEKITEDMKVIEQEVLE
jgi:hypothetical protein